MANQLAFAVVTPYTIRKSRTGAILARLLGRTSSQLVATRMFAPTREFADAYADTIRPAEDPEREKYRCLIREYIRENFGPDAEGHRHRALMLVFKGRNAHDDIRNVVGRLRISCTTGETIRDTYGDLVYNADGTVRYFEPAVLTAESPETVCADLRMWLDFARNQPPLLEDICVYGHPKRVQQTLVLIKPDSWRQGSLRPGSVIDMFSRTGLRIICMKLCRISVAQALEFYGPVEQVLRRKLAPGIGARARRILERELEITLPDEVVESLTENVGVPYAHDQFERIVEFMSGRRPSVCSAEEREREGLVSCLALVYEGEQAIAKIRDVLGPTDPTKAPYGTVRREFGSDVMVNTAHASDSPENARREMRILRVKDDSFVPAVEQALEEFE